MPTPVVLQLAQRGLITLPKSLREALHKGLTGQPHRPGIASVPVPVNIDDVGGVFTAQLHLMNDHGVPGQIAIVTSQTARLHRLEYIWRIIDRDDSN